MKAKRILIGASATLAFAATAVGVFAGVEASAYDASLDKVYDVPLPELARSSDPAVIERGKHVVDGLAGCADKDCHGADLGGGNTVELGPLGRFTGTNISAGGLAVAYTDGELARIIRHGVKRDGRSVRFMPVPDFRWLPDEDVVAAISYMRSLPAVDRPNGPTQFSAFAKVLDRQDKFVIDVARRIDHGAFVAPPPPSPTAEYGRFLANGCTSCHGKHLSGGPIPGAPSTLPVPLDLTPHDAGLGHWTAADFDRAMTLGIRPDGRKLDPFMMTGRLNDTEKQALWAYLQTIPPMPFGQR
jgi:cytochrome c5